MYKNYSHFYYFSRYVNRFSSITNWEVKVAPSGALGSAFKLDVTRDKPSCCKKITNSKQMLSRLYQHKTKTTASKCVAGYHALKLVLNFAEQKEHAGYNGCMSIKMAVIGYIQY